MAALLMAALIAGSMVNRSIISLASLRGVWHDKLYETRVDNRVDHLAIFKPRRRYAQAMFVVTIAFSS